MPLAARRIFPAVLLSLLFGSTSWAVDQQFHNAPDSAKAMKNPYAGQQAAADAGKTLYARNCLACHGKAGQGTGNVPSLVDGKLKGVPQGEVFWFITKGKQGERNAVVGVSAGEKRWQIVTYVETMAAGKASAGTPALRRPQ